jgi:hypothetical protein
LAESVAIDDLSRSKRRVGMRLWEKAEYLDNMYRRHTKMTVLICVHAPTCHSDVYWLRFGLKIDRVSFWNAVVNIKKKKQ